MSRKLLIQILYTFVLLSVSRAKPSIEPPAWDPEAEYVTAIGNRPVLSWPEAAKARAAKNGLLFFSSEVHKQTCEAQGKKCTRVAQAKLGWGTLKFYDSKFRPMRIPVLQYKVDKNGGLGKGYIWYFVTKGPRADCVYHLSLLSDRQQTYYVGNGAPVCGIKIENAFACLQRTFDFHKLWSRNRNYIV